MNDRTLNVLEFDQVLAAAGSLCQTALGREKTLGLRPGTDIGQIELELDRVAEMTLLVEVEGGLDFFGLHDLTPFQDHLETPGTFLGPEELDLFGQTLRCLSRNRKKTQALAGEYPLLARLGKGLSDHGALIRVFDKTFGPGLTIADSASPALAKIRERTAGLKNDIRRELETLMTDPRAKGTVREEIVTQRNDRFVLPVKAGLQNRMEGIIHDSSASRRTVFVEPLSIVPKNNQLGLMAAEERREVIRILTDLTDGLREVWPELQAQIEITARLDCLQARARLSRRLKSIRPEIGRTRLQLIGARHPLLLLAGQGVVPVDLHFPEGKKILIISGPNAGGKTVALKTLGLLHLMALSGLPIPAEEGSIITFSSHIAALIGDDQAISDGASTFSARLKWFKEILDTAGSGSLILIDELGGGTDPAEGAALGLAVLDRLAEKGVRVLATTHLSFIKAYASGNELAENLSVQFDPGTRRPTYELSYGQPGLSNAFETAASVGLDPRVTAGAREYLSGDEEKFKGLLEKLNRLINGHQKRTAELAAREEALAQARQEVTRLKTRLEEDREKFLREEGGRIREIIGRAEKKLVMTLKRAESRDVKERERARYEFYETKSGLRRSLEGREQPGLSQGRAESFENGHEVRVEGFNRPGVVTGKMRNGRLLEIRLAGGMKVKIEPARLKHLEGRAKKKERTWRSSDSRSTGRSAIRPAPARTWPEINIIGLRVAEALPKVDKALDEAILSGLAKLSVIHGVGTGALRQAVREFLADHPQVKTFSSPEGLRGAGLTEIELSG